MADRCRVTTQAAAEVYAGRCEIRREVLPAALDVAGTKIAVYRYTVGVPHAVTTVQIGHLLEVLASDDPVLVGASRRVVGVDGDSYATVRSLELEVDFAAALVVSMRDVATVRRRTADGPNRHNATTYTWNDAATYPALLGRYESEELPGDARRVNTAPLVLPAAADITGADIVMVNGDEHEVTGDPVREITSTGDVAYTVARVRKVAADG